MYKYVKASSENVYSDCKIEVLNRLAAGFENEDFMSYDDVVSEVYAGIQDYFENQGITLHDDTEDALYEEIMNKLASDGYIDHKKGLILPPPYGYDI